MQYDINESNTIQIDDYEENLDVAKENCAVKQTIERCLYGRKEKEAIRVQ